MQPAENVRVKGQVRILYPTTDGTNIALRGLSSGETPGGEGFFFLDLDHPNYNALFSLALVAATNRYELLIRTVVARLLQPACAIGRCCGVETSLAQVKREKVSYVALIFDDENFPPRGVVHSANSTHLRDKFQSFLRLLMWLRLRQQQSLPNRHGFVIRL